MSEQQTMTSDTEAEATPSAEGTGASDDLDSLLNEFDSETPEKTEPEKTPTGTAQPDPNQERILRAVNKLEAEQTEKDIRASIDVIKSFAGKEDGSDDDYIEAMLYRDAAKDSRVRMAFAQRDAKPAEWRKILKAYGDKIAKRAEVDNKATADWRAVESAERSASKSTPPPDENPKDFQKKVKGMSNQEFFAFQKDWLRGGRKR